MSDDIKKIGGTEQFRPENELSKDLQQEIDDALGDISIEDLLSESEPSSSNASEKPKAKGIKSGTVIDIQPDAIFVDMGGKSQGILPPTQFSEEEEMPSIGDIVEVTIAGYDKRDGLLMLSRQGAVLAATWESLAVGQNVEGRVTGHNKGGLELSVNRIESFMPVSQIERFGGVEDMAPYVDQRMQCQVIEVNRGEKKVVVSRRKLLDEQAAEQAETLFEELQEGQTVTGTVRSIMPYGAFVDIGGADGLLHVKEMAHKRVEDPNEIVSIGLEVTVVISSIDKESKKIGLSLVKAMPDPWDAAEVRFPVGQIVTGRVTKLMDFGAFMEVEEGLEGLIPIGEMTFGKRIGHPKEVIKEGEVVKAKILSVDVERKRMSLSLKQTVDDPWTGASMRWPVDSTIEGIVTRLAEFGAFVELSPGIEGLIHISQLSDKHVRLPGDVVREGDTVTAKVLEVDEDRRRISLSIKAMSEDDGGNWTMEDIEPQPERKRKKPLKGGLESGGLNISMDMFNKKDGKE